MMVAVGLKKSGSKSGSGREAGNILNTSPRQSLRSLCLPKLESAGRIVIPYVSATPPTHVSPSAVYDRGALRTVLASLEAPPRWAAW